MACTKETVRSNGLNIWSSHSDAISEVEVDIVAVQGLGAHPFYTWVKRSIAGESTRKRRRTAMTFIRNKDEHGEENSTEVMWPRDLLLPLFKNARVATYSYESDWRKSGVKTSLRECAEQLLNVIFQHRQDAPRRPLVFIGHSLGGLVIQQALTIAVHQQAFTDVRLSVAGIIFLGAPFQGSDVAVYGKWLAEAGGYDSTMLDMLRKDNPSLHTVSQDFWHSYSEWDIVCFYESKDAAYGPWKARIVDAQSATFLGKRIMFLSTDHSGLNKFDGLQDENFALLVPEIKRMVKGAPSIVADRFRIEASGASRLEVSSNVPFPQDALFVDRKDIMADLEAKISNPLHHQRVALVGLGGMGKSQIAIEYSYRLRTRSSSTWVFWVHASSRTRFELGYRDIADTIKLRGKDDPKAEILQLVYQWLRDEKNGPWLLILDNADDANIFTFTSSTHEQNVDASHQSLLAYIPQTSNGSVLVTSRNNEAAFRLTNETHLISVGQMNETECLSLLKRKLRTESLSTDSSGLELVTALDRIPLAIIQAAGYISITKRMNVTKYLKLFVESEDNQASLLDKDAGDLRRDPQVPNAVIKTWQISFTQIRRDSPSAADLLSLMSVLHRQGIPESVLCDNSDELAFTDALRVLSGFSLITEESDGDTFEMHRLVQLATKKWLHANGEIVEWHQKALMLISKGFPSGVYENWTKCMPLLSHVEAVLSFDLRDPDDLLTQARILQHLAWYFKEKGDYQHARLKIDRCIEIRSRYLSDDHPDSLNSMNNCAVILEDQGKYEEAEQMHRQTLQLKEKVLGSEHPDTLISMNNLAATLISQSKYKEAEQMHRQTLQLSRKILGSEHPDTLCSMGNLAAVLSDQQRYDEAELMHRQTIQLRIKMLGAEHPRTLNSMNNLATVLIDQKRYDEAELMHRQTIQSRRKVLGAEHPYTLNSMNNLATVLIDHKRYDETEQLHRQTLSLSEKVLGSQHPDTLNSMRNLALTFGNQSKYEEAESLFRETLQLKKKIFGSEHSETLKSMKNLAVTLEKQNKYEEAESLFRETLQLQEKIFGSEHSETLKSMRNLAIILDRQSKYEKAESLFRETLQLKEKKFGFEHSETLESMKDLAIILDRQSKYEEAKPMSQQVLKLENGKPESESL